MFLDMDFKFKVSKREGKVKGDTLCAGVVSGKKIESVSLEFDQADFQKMFTKTGYSTIITLEGLGEEVEAMVHRLDVTPGTNMIRHVEFYAVERGVEMSADVPLKLINEAPAEKLGAMITQVTHEVSITCMPRNLIHEIEVDTSLLKEIGDQICVKDLVVPSTITIDLDPDTVIMSASEPKAEKKAEEVVEDPAVTDEAESSEAEEPKAE